MSRAPALLVALALACRPTISIGSNDEGSSTAAAIDASTSSTTAVLEPTSSEASSGADASTSGTTLVGNDGEGSSESVGPPPPACFHEPYDSFCVGCAKEACCEEFAACAADFGCGCALGCLQHPGPYPCGCPPHARANALQGCLESFCAFACET